jgi:DNA-binding MarR family transcriptional regulator
MMKQMKSLATPTPSSRLETFAKRLVELLPQLIRGLAQRESNLLSKGEITLPQLWALEYLSREGAVPMNRLARFLKISRPNATHLADRLIAQGLIRRIANPMDRRMVQLTLTPKGERALRTIWDQKRRMIEEIFGQLKEEERWRYLKTIERVVEILRQKEGKEPVR